MEIKLTFEWTFPHMKYIHVTYYYSPEPVKIQYDVFYLSQTKRENNYYYEKVTVTTTSDKRVRKLYHLHPTLVIEFYLIISFCYVSSWPFVFKKKKKTATKDEYITFTRITANGYQRHVYGSVLFTDQHCSLKQSLLKITHCL